MISGLIFYLFSTVLVLSALGVITTRNTVHGVLFLILAFFNASGLFVLLGAEFLAMLLLIVYVGAVAVLFLFVVMMLDVSVLKTRKDWLHYLPLGASIGGLMVFELAVVFSQWDQTSYGMDFVQKPIDGSLTNTEAIGTLLYTDYALLFQTAGLILLVAMIGAITLTFRRRAGVRRQNVNKQTSVKPSEVVENMQPKSGEGVNV